MVPDGPGGEGLNGGRRLPNVPEEGHIGKPPLDDSGPAPGAAKPPVPTPPEPPVAPATPKLDRSKLPAKVQRQIEETGVPSGGQTPFKPKLKKNRKGDLEMEKGVILEGPKRGKKGFVDEDGRIWIRDPGHSGYPDHWGGVLLPL
jgi:hypothetical protein